MTLLLSGVLLLFLSMQAVHTHPVGSAPDLQHCALCMAAHAVPLVVAGLTAWILFAAQGRVAVPQARAGHRLVFSQLWIRPPPFSKSRLQNV